MNSFWISFNAVVPMFCIIFLGMYFKKKEYLSEKAVLQMNKLTFVCFTPVLIFKNIYTSGGLSALHPSLMIFTAIVVLAVFALGTVTVMAIEKSPKKRGAMIQAIFRSNFTLFGVPLAINLFGEDMGSSAGFTEFDVGALAGSIAEPRLFDDLGARNRHRSDYPAHVETLGRELHAPFPVRNA